MSRSAARMPVAVAEEVPFNLVRFVATFCLLMGTLPRFVFGIGPITTVSASSDTNSDDKKQAVATCPPGTIAFSGGASTFTPLEPFGGELAVVYSAPTGDPPTEWVVMAQEMIATTDNWRVGAVAFCADIPGYTKVSAGSPITSDNYKAIDVSCPQGTRAIGGGSAVISTPDNLVLLIENRPKGNGWSAAAVEFSPTAGSWLLGVVASCIPESDLDLEIISALFAPALDHNLTLSCAAYRSAIGGGWRVSGNHEAIAAIDSFRLTTPQNWFVKTNTLKEGEWVISNLEAYALCLSGEIFSCGFESGNSTAWSSTVQ